MVKNPPANAGDKRDKGEIPGSGRSPKKEMATHFTFLSGKTHEQRSPVGSSPWSHKESDMTEQMSMDQCQFNA